MSKSPEIRVVPLDRCVCCKSKQPVFVRMTDEGARTSNFSGSCQNRKCPLYTDPAMTPSWKQVSMEYASILDKKLSVSLSNII